MWFFFTEIGEVTHLFYYFKIKIIINIIWVSNVRFGLFVSYNLVYFCVDLVHSCVCTFFYGFYTRFYMIDDFEVSA